MEKRRITGQMHLCIFKELIHMFGSQEVQPNVIASGIQAISKLVPKSKMIIKIIFKKKKLDIWQQLICLTKAGRTLERF